MLKNTEKHWGSVARTLHWLMAVLIASQIVLGKTGHEMARSPAKLEILTWHKSIGVVLLLLVTIRLAWRWSNPVPMEPAGTPWWQQRAARLSHILLYFLMLGLPISGWILNSASNFPMKVFWLVPWPDITGPSEKLAETAEEGHETLALLLVIVVTIHVAAALWHHFWKRDDVLRRMWNSGREDH